MFVLNSEITIGGFRFSGAHEVSVTRGIHSLVETAVIKLPAMAKIVREGKTDPMPVVTAKQLKVGHEVTIKLGYNGALKTEFRGFVKQLKMNMPLEVLCEGYSWLLRSNKPQVPVKGKLADLLEAAVNGLANDKKIVVECGQDIELEGLHTEGRCGFDIIEAIRKATDNALTCFFRDPDVLWCGLLYSNQPNGASKEVTAQYRLGYNCLSENTLAAGGDDGGVSEVVYIKAGSKTCGPLLVLAGTGKTGAIHKAILNNVKNERTLKMLATEKAHSKKHNGHEGKITGFLQPYAAPGNEVSVQGSKDTDLDGTYMVESTEVHFGTTGARRVMELGLKR